MRHKLEVFLGRTNVVPVSFGEDISADTFVSEIRDELDVNSDLIVTWTSSWATDGTDGELILTLQNEQLSGVTAFNGFMDIKRVSGGEPIPAFGEVIEVFFRKTVTE